MLTPEIKTNLILKEIGIQRYSLRPQGKIISQKTYHYFLKGKILAIFDKPFENFVREQQDLIKAVLTSTKLDQGEEIFENAFFDSQESLQQKISSFNDILTSQMGTILYSSPQILHSLAYTSKTDIWSLGIIFYLMIYGIFPWDR